MLPDRSTLLVFDVQKYLSHCIDCFDYMIQNSTVLDYY